MEGEVSFLGHWGQATSTEHLVKCGTPAQAQQQGRDKRGGGGKGAEGWGDKYAMKEKRQMKWQGTGDLEGAKHPLLGVGLGQADQVLRPKVVKEQRVEFCIPNPDKSNAVVQNTPSRPF